MVYYKQLSDNYILAIGTGPGGTEITELNIIPSSPPFNHDPHLKLKVIVCEQT